MKRSKVNTSKRNNRRTTVRRRMMGGMEAAAPAAGAAAGAAGALNRRLENLTERDEIRKYINMLKDEINTKLGEPPSGTVLFLKGNTKHVKTAFENEELILEMSKACVILNDGDEIQEGGHFCHAFNLFPDNRGKLLRLHEEICGLNYNDKKALVNPAKRDDGTVPPVADLDWFEPGSDHNTLWGILCTTAINEVCQEKKLNPVCILLLSDDPNERNKPAGALNREIKFWSDFEYPPEYIVPRRDSEKTFVLSQ